MKKDKKHFSIKDFFNKNKRNLFIAVVILVIVFSIVLFNKYFQTKKTYTVVNGYVEKVSDTIAYLIKKESIVDSNSNVATIPVVEQGQKAAKNQIIAMYKTSKYDEYLSRIDGMDQEIQTLIKDLPETYSSEITNIDSQITNLSKTANGTTSYVKMQEYKNKIDELSYKKVVLLGELSPAGSKIRELIIQREKIETESTNSSDNIRANMTGIVTYKIDGLEEIADMDKVLKYDIAKFQSIMNSYGQNNINNFGIKIVDNYTAYILVKEPRGINDQYIKTGRNYTIKFTDKNSVAVTANLVNNLQNDEYNYLLFKITNGIENIVDVRATGAEVIWTRVNGMAIPKNAIKRSSDNNYDYVTIVDGGTYIDVPITVTLASDSICIVKSMSSEKRNELNINNKYELELYDILLIDD